MYGWVPSSASPGSYRPRPLTAPSQNIVVSPETFRCTGGGFNMQLKKAMQRY